MKPLRLVAAAGLAGAFVLTGLTVAQAAPAPDADVRTVASAQVSAPVVPQLNRTDEAFLRMGHQFHRFEILKSSMAVGKARCHAVRNLGIIEARHYRQADYKLRMIAARERVALPDHLTPQMARTLRVLAGKFGSDFDRTWLRVQTVAHRHAVIALRHEILSGRSHEVKQMARTALPIVQRHLAMLRTAQRTCSL